MGSLPLSLTSWIIKRGNAYCIFIIMPWVSLELGAHIVLLWSLTWWRYMGHILWSICTQIYLGTLNFFFMSWVYSGLRNSAPKRKQTNKNHQNIFPGIYFHNFQSNETRDRSLWLDKKYIKSEGIRVKSKQKEKQTLGYNPWLYVKEASYKKKTEVVIVAIYYS